MAGKLAHDRDFESEQQFEDMVSAKTDIEKRLVVFEKASALIECSLETLKNVKAILSANEKYLIEEEYPPIF